MASRKHTGVAAQRRREPREVPAPAVPTDDPGGYPGQRLGMPEAGSGSIARLGRRVVAVCIDWAVCTLIGVQLFGAAWGRPAESLAHTFIVPAVFAVENILLVGTAGFTIGHRVMGLHVLRLGQAPNGLWPALVRGILVALAVPALIWDRDQRGLHDKAAGTVLAKI